MFNKPVLSVDLKRLEGMGISVQELRPYLPKYILEPTRLSNGPIKEIWFSLLNCFLGTLVKVFLRPRQARITKLDSSEVNKVYTRVAKIYDRKHHLMTRGIDLICRRMAGWFIASIGRNGQDHLKILDLCTGTGLSIKEMIPILREWNIGAEITGLDNNKEMLAQARRNIDGADNVQLVQGDAMSLVETFSPDSMDAITQILGVGGIPEPLKVFDGVLRILKPGGQFLLIDSHKPIPEQPGEWPVFFKWHRFPLFEMRSYERFTIPLLLRSWGWRDPTPSFYLLPLITYQDRDDGQYWGFKVQSFEQETQRWWFGLPLISIAKITVEKVEINEEIARKRSAILETCSFALES